MSQIRLVISTANEFFRTDLPTILDVVKQNCGEDQYIADPAAFEYRESRTMRDEDADYIESVYGAAEEEGETVIED